MADDVRSYIRSAYSFGLKSEHDYRTASPRRFNLVYNPASGIPIEPKVAGIRWLYAFIWRQREPSASEVSFRTSPTATCAATGRHWPARLDSPRRSASASTGRGADHQAVRCSDIRQPAATSQIGRPSSTIRLTISARPSGVVRAFLCGLFILVASGASCGNDHLQAISTDEQPPRGWRSPMTLKTGWGFDHGR
jgi:hypothetical protein